MNPALMRPTLHLFQMRLEPIAPTCLYQATGYTGPADSIPFLIQGLRGGRGSTRTLFPGHGTILFIEHHSTLYGGRE